jgi:hypothetical protein
LVLILDLGRKLLGGKLLKLQSFTGVAEARKTKSFYLNPNSSPSLPSINISVVSPFALLEPTKNFRSYFIAMRTE